jgi:hypothetical protein
MADRETTPRRRLFALVRIAFALAVLTPCGVASAADAPQQLSPAPVVRAAVVADVEPPRELEEWARHRFERRH